MVRIFHRRLWLPCLLAGVALVLPSCATDGHIEVLGYTSRPNYDLSIKTVHVPIFKNLSFRRGLEFDLTRAVVNEIQKTTPYRVVSDPCRADTELVGTIVSLNKNNVNINQLNEVRESQTVMTVQLVWRDLRPGHTGEILSAPRTPGAPPPVPGAPPPPPVVIQSEANFIPELGGSLTTAAQRNINKLAVQIVSMMEMPW